MEEKTLFNHSLLEICNLNEEFVIKKIESILSEDTSICRCRLCIEDMYALSLNMLPTRYVQSTYRITNFFNELDEKKAEELIEDAIYRVIKNPHH